MTARPPAAVPAGRVALVSWSAFLAGCLAALHAVGGPLAPPPLSEPAALGPWLDARAPVEAAFALARLVALALAWYLLAATAAGVLARLSGAVALVRLADAVSVPTVRRLVHGAVGLSMAAAVASASTGTAYAAPPSAVPDSAASGRATGPPPTMRLLPSGSTGTAGTTGDDGAPGSTGTAGTAGDDGAPGSTGTAGTAGDDGPSGHAPAVPDPGPTAAGQRQWTVRAGDHLWSVAERNLAAEWGRPPTDAEVDPYWRAVVEANRAGLRDPSNPDLVFPGQVLVLPNVPPPPG